MNEKADRKGWAYLAVGKVARLVPHAVDIVFTVACMGLVLLGVQIFNDTSRELQELINAGELPDCLLYYPGSMMIMAIGAILFLFWRTRRK